MIVRIALCIPTYNNHGTLDQVIEDALNQTPFPILVIDDGSTPTLSLSNFSQALQSKRLILISHLKNKGKGIAIQTAFQEGIKRGFTHLITLDGDGQHLVSEIPKFVTAIKENPWKLILGCRKFSAPNVPEISRFGRKFSNFWVKFETDIKISDSQSGFRAYPLFQIQTLRFWTKKFDFEIEVLIRLLWRGVSIHEIEIDVYYPPPEERVSHFDKLWDNVRISLLNTLFVILSLFKSHQSTPQISIALGLGVFIGCTPLYGLHSLVAAFLCLILRMNFVYAWIGTQISIPPLVPLLIFASVSIGKKLHINWIFGSLFLGTALGLLTCILSFGIITWVSYQKKNAQKSAWSGKMRGGKFGNWFLKTVTLHLGLKPAYFCLYFIFPYFYFFAPSARKASNEYWSIIRPETNWLKRQFLVMNHFHYFGKVLLDRLYANVRPKAYFKTVSDGHENVVNAVLEKKPLILLSAHAGGWDLASRALQNEDEVSDFTTVQYEASELKTKLLSIRASAQAANLPILEIKNSLENGIPIGLMGDRPVGTHFELVHFFGKLAPMDTTPFRIASACNAYLLFTFGFRGNDHRYYFYAQKLREMKPGNAREKLILGFETLQDFASELELKIKQYPEQWFNFFPFWSTIPKPPLGIESGKLQNHLKEELHKP